MEFCDSSGLSALIAAHHHAHTAQADKALEAVPASTLPILRMVGLDQISSLGQGGDDPEPLSDQPVFTDSPRSARCSRVPAPAHAPIRP
ncbi:MULTISPECIES: hypothetical protein [unclassified Streptomyces]|uniref:hypothetical protein n=1 Tax=unclassified Streptomyces TaxID=2593676 RepID=UPI0033A5B547